MSLDDTLAKAAIEARELRDRIRELEATVDRLGHDNNDQCDTIAELQTTARKAGLDASAKQALDLIRRYVSEGDALDSARVLCCLRRMLDATSEMESAA